jgi:hypothetical protein
VSTIYYLGDQSETYFSKDEYTVLEQSLPPADSEVRFEAFSPKKIVLGQEFNVTFAAYNFSFEREIHETMSQQGKKVAGSASNTLKLALRTSVSIILKNPHKQLKCSKKGTLSFGLARIGCVISTFSTIIPTDWNMNYHATISCS